MLQPSPYEPEDSSSEESVDSEDIYEHDHTNNIGYHERFRENDGRFMNNRKHSEYSEIRNKLFTPKIRGNRILVDSSNHSTSNKNEYIVRFDESNDHSTEGDGINKNVIALNLISCCIGNRLNTVHSNNNKLILNVLSTKLVLVFGIGVYTITSLISELQTVMNGSTPASISFTITSDSEEILTITENGGNPFTLDFLDTLNEELSSAGTLLGFPHVNHTGSHTYTGKHSVRFRSIYVDLVIPEIPYIACKKNPHSKRIVERIPLTSGTNRLIFHTPEEYTHTNYFTPINLDRITIQLFDENKNIPYNSLQDNFFEFEIITLHNIDIL